MDSTTSNMNANATATEQNLSIEQQSHLRRTSLLTQRKPAADLDRKPKRLARRARLQELLAGVKAPSTPRPRKYLRRRGDPELPSNILAPHYSLSTIRALKDKAPEETAPEETAPENTTPKCTAPEDTTPKHTTPEDTAPEDTAPEDIAPEETAPEVTASVDTAPKTVSGISVPELTTSTAQPRARATIRLRLAPRKTYARVSQPCAKNAPCPASPISGSEDFIVTAPIDPASFLYTVKLIKTFLLEILAISIMGIVTFCSAVASVGGSFGRFVSHQYQNVIESRSYRDDSAVATKRRKLAFSNDSQFSWIDHLAITSLVQKYQAFSGSFSYIWKTAAIASSRAQVNKLIQPLQLVLVDDPADLQKLKCGSHLALFELFERRCEQVFGFLEKLYEAGHLLKLRDQYPKVPISMDHQSPYNDLETVKRVKAFMSHPQLPAVCNDVLLLADFNNVDISSDFINRIVLDMHAIMHQLPLPSFVSSPEFQSQLGKLYPPPHITDSNIHELLPGGFPELGHQITPQNQSTRTCSSPSLSDSAMSAGSPTICVSDSSVDENINDKYQPKSQTETACSCRSQTSGPLQSVLKDRADHSHRRSRIVEFSLDALPNSRIPDEDDKIAALFMDPDFLDSLDPPTKPSNSPKAPETETRSARVENDGKERLLNPKELVEFGKWRTERRHKLEEEKAKKTESERVDDLLSELLYLPSLEKLLISDESKDKVERLKKQLSDAEARLKEKEEERQRELRISKGPRIPVVDSLSEEWIEKVAKTIDAPASQVLATTCQNVPLKRHDFATVVADKAWLNDEIVNATLAYLDKEINSAAGITNYRKQGRKCLAMNSFFWPRVVKSKGKDTDNILRRMGVSKFNFMKIDNILIPICDGNHWTLMVVQPTKCRICHIDSFNEEDPAPPLLALEWIKNFMGEFTSPFMWSLKPYRTPQQTNGYDCGVHCITNAMCFALGLDPNQHYSSEQMALQRLRIAAMLLNGGFNGDFDLWLQ